MILSTGFFSTVEEETRLYRVLDITLKRRLGQKIFGLGSIEIRSTDKTNPIVTLQSIKKSAEVKEMISKMVEEARAKNRVSGRELLNSADDREEDEEENRVDEEL